MRIPKITTYCTGMAAALSVLASCAGSSSRPDDLTRLAAEEYTVAVRPGGNGNPFWNVQAKRFIYTPVFDIPETSGASNYRFTLTQPDGGKWEFTAASPLQSLASVWNDIPVGETELTVQPLDASGATVGEPYKRNFMRDFPYVNNEAAPDRDYREAALKAIYNIHKWGPTQHWLNAKEPDMTFENNVYACKIVGSTIALECLVAENIPQEREEALTIARNAAQYLIDNSRPADAPLAYFPPTYNLTPADTAQYTYGVVRDNKGKTMFMEAVIPADAFLDLYDITGDSLYLNHAVGIADTYSRTQASDGSWPIKVDYNTGESLVNMKSTPSTLLSLFSRLRENYGIDRYADNIRAAEQWMDSVALPRFDLTGQFEDQPMDKDQKPYMNLTSCPPTEYACYLLGKPVVTDKEIADATDLIRLVEDQFVHWDVLPNESGFKMEHVPSVHEQYFYEVGVDNSAASTAAAMTALYNKTGDKLALAKARTLTDAIVASQDPTNGHIPTLWFYSPTGEYQSTWPNCTLMSARQLLRMAAMND